jgi:adenylosuccinate synthase
VAYKINGKSLKSLPLNADNIENCEPEYIIMPGWKSSTVGVTDFDALPQEAKDYINKVESLLDVPIDMISTGPERSENIIRRSIY